MKSSRESRKSKCRKMSDVKACKKKAWKSKSKTLQRMAASPKKQKKKGKKKFNLKTILLNSILNFIK